MISTKGRYALRVLIDLAEQDTTTYVPLKEIAKRQGISEKYIQQIVKILVGRIVNRNQRKRRWLPTNCQP